MCYLMSHRRICPSPRARAGGSSSSGVVRGLVGSQGLAMVPGLDPLKSSAPGAGRQRGRRVAPGGVWELPSLGGLSGSLLHLFRHRGARGAPGVLPEVLSHSGSQRAQGHQYGQELPSPGLGFSMPLEG
jgi:hypothetical protein